MSSPSSAAGAEENWPEVFAQLNEGVLLAAEDQAIVFANAACLRFFDWKTRIVGRPLSILREPTLISLTSALLDGGEAREDEITVHRESVSRLLRVRAQLLSGSEKTRARILFTFSDVTILRSLEGAATDVVANVSHELRTPISVLAGYIENLADFPKMPRVEQVEIFEIMQEHATRLKVLLDDFLTLACFESRSDVLDYTNLNLRQFLQRLQKDWRPALATKDMTFVIEVAENANTLRVDRFRFEQVLHNLIDNAFKYTPIEGTIRVRAAAVDDRIEICVEDNGAGIPEEDLPHIFDRFYRVDKARTRKYGGTGLGLSIVRHIVELHGGTVRAESTLQMSTRVIILLPREKAE